MPGMWKSLVLTLVCALSLVASSRAPAQPAANQPAAKESSNEAKQQYTAAARLHNAGEYAVAADEWAKLLKDHAQDPLATKARYFLGVCQMQLKKLPAAEQEFTAVLKNPQFEMADDARFHLGWVLYSQAEAAEAAAKPELFKRAVATFTELEQKSPKGKLTDQALWFHGECLYLQDQFELAAATYGKLIADFPESKRRPDALYAQAFAFQRVKQYDSAGKAYDQFLQEFAQHELRDSVRLGKAETLYEAGQYAPAEALFGELAALPGFPRADYALSRQAAARARQDKPAEAAAIYVELVEKHPQSALVGDATLLAAKAFYQAGDKAQSAAWFDKALALPNLAPVDAIDAAHWRCKLLLDSPEGAGAAAALADKTLKAHAEAATAAEAAGQPTSLAALRTDAADAAYRDPAQRPAAVQQYLAVEKDFPKSPLAPQSLYYAAFGLMELDQLDQAVAEAQRFLVTYPMDKLVPDVTYVAADCQLRLKKYPEAEVAYAALLKQSPEHPELPLWTLRHALAIYLQKKYAETEAALTPALAKLSEPARQAEAQYLIGASRFYRDQFPESAQSLEASLKADPRWRQADETLLLLSRCQQRQDKLDDAITTAKRLLAELPQSGLVGQAHYRLGEYLFAKQDFVGAEAEYKLAEAAGDAAFVPYAIYGRGWSLFKGQKFPEAVAAFTSLLDGHKDHPLAADGLLLRGMARRAAKELEPALADFKAFLATNPAADKACDALYEQGLTQVALDQNEPAAASFEAILKQSPEYSHTDGVLYELGWVQKTLGQAEAASRTFATLAEKHAASSYAGEALFHVGDYQYDQKQYAEAATAYTGARDKSDATSDVHEKAQHKLGWSLFHQQKYAEAEQAFAAQLKDHPQGGNAADALFMQAESLFKQEKQETALPLFEKAAATRLSSPALDVLARLHGAQCATHLKQWPKCMQLVGTVPEQFAESPFLAEALLERAYARQHLGAAEQPKALEDYARCATLAKGTLLAKCYFLNGELLFELKRHVDAIKEFKRVMYVFDSQDPQVKSLQAQAGFEAGRCAEVLVTDPQQAATRAENIGEAKKCYEFVVSKHAEHPMAAQAKKRLDELAKL